MLWSFGDARSCNPRSAVANAAPGVSLVRPLGLGGAQILSRARKGRRSIGAPPTPRRRTVNGHGPWHVGLRRLNREAMAFTLPKREDSSALRSGPHLGPKPNVGNRRTDLHSQGWRRHGSFPRRLATMGDAGRNGSQPCKAPLKLSFMGFRPLGIGTAAGGRWPNTSDSTQEVEDLH